MVKKETIGKIQLIIGIIILIVGILGLYYSFYSPKVFLPKSGGIEGINDTQQILYFKSSNVYLSINIITTLISTSVIIILLSLLFITQGLLNMSGEKKVWLKREKIKAKK